MATVDVTALPAHLRAAAYDASAIVGHAKDKGMYRDSSAKPVAVHTPVVANRFIQTHGGFEVSGTIDTSQVRARIDIDKVAFKASMDALVEHMIDRGITAITIPQHIAWPDDSIINSAMVAAVNAAFSKAIARVAARNSSP